MKEDLKNKMAHAKSVNEPLLINKPKKTACTQLNEIHPGVQYEVINASGPPHCPVFDISVTVNGQTFTGRGGSKKIAREAAAESVLSVVDQLLQVDDQNQLIIMNKSSINAKPDKPTVSCEQEDTKSPVTKLNEMLPDLEYKISDIVGPVHRRKFTVQVLFDDKVYQGTGAKIKLAKTAAARAVLQDISYKKEYILQFPRLFSEKIERMIQECLETIQLKHPGFRKTGVLAGIAMFKAEDRSTVKIVAIAYGGECMESSESDCHVIVLIRRCFLLYLYFQMELHLEGKTSESVFEKAFSGKFRLKDGIQFYLYVSSTPCDDSRKLIKAKISVEPGTPESYLEDKIDRDSCQIRLSKWNFLGIQGDLLNHILEHSPISFNQIIYARSLRSKYKLNLVCDNQRIERHSFGNRLMSQEYAECLNSSAIWSQEMSDVEFVTCVKGKLELKELAQIAHHNLFQRFLRILKYIKGDVYTTECFYPKMYDTDYKLVNSASFQ